MNELEERKELSLASSTEELEQRIMETDDPVELQKVIDLFNINIKKKDIIRTGKLNQLQDKTLEQMAERINKNPDLFTNKDLLDYFKVMQETINKADVTSNNMPKIQVNQQIINVNNQQQDGLSRESKEKVMDLVKAIIQQSDESDVIDVEVKGENNNNENDNTL